MSLHLRQVHSPRPVPVLNVVTVLSGFFPRSALRCWSLGPASRLLLRLPIACHADSISTCCALLRVSLGSVGVGGSHIFWSHGPRFVSHVFGCGFGFRGRPGAPFLRPTVACADLARKCALSVPKLCAAMRTWKTDSKRSSFRSRRRRLAGSGSAKAASSSFFSAALCSDSATAVQLCLGLCCAFADPRQRSRGTNLSQAATSHFFRYSH
jgi:hypothetical protein